ncbi:MAG: serine hydrolase [Anaerolineae bacterium]|nr:serine hydrolase [Anaerolineae bacterium]
MSADYGRLGERQRGMQLPLLEILSSLLLLGAILVGMFELVNYSNDKESLPTDLTMAGIAVGGLSESDALARLEAAYVDQPIQLYYDGNPIVLQPAEINFRLNSDAMLAEARSQNSQEKNFWAGFWNYLGRQPVAAVTVSLSAGYPTSDLRGYLHDIAARYDTPPGEARVDLNTLTFQSGAFGRELDIDAAMSLIDSILYNPDPAARRIDLPLSSAGASSVNMETLQQAIFDLMAAMGFNYAGDQTLASVYIMDLSSGEEVKILADVPHSARSVIKIPIMINIFRDQLVLDADTSYLLTESILCSNNSSSNFLMQTAGTGPDAFDFETQLRLGLNQVSCTAQALGADHTFISAPLYVADRAYEFEAAVCRPSTPGNTAYNTNADPFAQTTAQDMGVLLAQIYDCANYGSGLAVLYPDDILQTECQQMIEVLSGNRIDRLLELGLPPGTRFAHKNGWGIETSADAGIVFSPGGDYVISIFTWELDTDGNDLPTLASWELIEEISRLTYNFFNPAEPLTIRREPLNAFGAIDCVTVESPELVNLNDIDQNRLDENGLPLSTACYGGAGDCRPFDNWGRDAQ